MSIRRNLSPRLFLLLSLWLVLGNCSKHKGAIKEAPAAPPFCPVQKVTVIPDRAAGPELFIGSNAKVVLQAQTTDASGKPRETGLVWRFKAAAENDLGLEAGDGHTLTQTGPETAEFRAAGRAAGDFWIEAKVPECVGADSIAVTGLAKITVAPDPDLPAQCGRLRVRYSFRDLGNETVLGFVMLNFWAEVYTRPELKQELRVRFFLNDRMVKPVRRLYLPLDDTPAAGFSAHFRARMPIFLERGQFRAWFELLQGEQVLCASEEVSFATR
jgi:hypothetical protein